MVDVRGDVLRPPHGTTPAAVKSNKNHIFVKNVMICFYDFIFYLETRIFERFKAAFHSFKHFCMHMLYNISGNSYHITDIGNVNNITVTYLEYPYTGFDALRNKNMQSIFQYVTQQPFNIFEEL